MSVIVEEYLKRLTAKRKAALVSDICRSSKNPKSLLPISPSSWYRGVKEGRFPKPRKLGRMSIWRLEDIKHLAESASVVDD